MSVAMELLTGIELRKYLRETNPAPEPVFESFLEMVDLFTKFRATAENHYPKQRHRSKSKRGALPLDWGDIATVLNPKTDQPEESLVTFIVRDCLSEVEQLSVDLRKILLRERKRTPLGRVQQVDTHCLRWLSKQPGRNVAEKAGGRQRILSVVRRENYDTLENRVLKDFAIRVRNLSQGYLFRNEPQFKEYESVKKVRRLSKLCLKILQNPIMDEIKKLVEHPHPNYVLRQERRYSKMWQAYCKVVRHAHIAERLWERKQEIEELVIQLRKEVLIHTHSDAAFHCPLWFPPIDGKQPLIDQPFYKNEIRRVKREGAITTNDFELSETGDVIVDLENTQNNLLIYSNHENAKPYLQDYAFPSIENIQEKNHFFLKDIISRQDDTRLGDYFEQLYAKVGGERWFILVPDDWLPAWQETVIRATPLPRNRVFLLWRSVAAILGNPQKLKGCKEGDSVIVIDNRSNRTLLASKLSLANEPKRRTLIPQRRAFTRHPDHYLAFKWEAQSDLSFKDKFLYGACEIPFYSAITRLRLENIIDKANCVIKVADTPKVLKFGVQEFIKLWDSGKIAYFDELEALSIIGQTSDERIEARTLVEANEKHPGGYETDPVTLENAATVDTLSADDMSKVIRFLVCMGEVQNDSKLKEYLYSLSEDVAEKVPLTITAKMTPGQGMAVVNISSDFLAEPIVLDFLNNMTDSSSTIRSLEETMDRSFPPDAPLVIANDNMWRNLRFYIEKYIEGDFQPNGEWFAKAKWCYPIGAELPRGVSPLERLRRTNVFGNEPSASLPGRLDFIDFKFDFKLLFETLSQDYYDSYGTRRDNIARLIAWTYQSKFKGFVDIRREVLKKISLYSHDTNQPAPTHQELTLCANLCVHIREWKELFNAILNRISNYDNSVTRDFYLLYNLLQFHPTIIRDTKMHLNGQCWLWVQHFPYWIERHRHGGGTALNYILKSLLYFLRCRLYDGKVFLSKDKDEARYELIYQHLQKRFYNTAEPTRKITLRYLNGAGNIGDIITLET